MAKVLDSLKMIQCEGDRKFLGLSYLVGRFKKQIFQYIKDRITKEVTR